MTALDALVTRAKSGDLEAYGQLVRATQRMVHATAFAVLRDVALAQDAAQETYLRAFRRLASLDEPSAFAAWLRRIAVTVASNARRARRTTLLVLDDAPAVPVLDEEETRWSAGQRRLLAAALLTLSSEDRRTCERRYHGRWSVARLAQQAGVGEPAIRKRLQRIRDKLRKEIEVTEQDRTPAEALRDELPERIVELLARPKLTDLPENPVGETLETLRGVFADHAVVELPEVLDLKAAGPTLVPAALYIGRDELHHIGDGRILRFDLMLPLLLAAEYVGEPLRLWAEGKVYRACQSDATHLEAFHQAEALWVDERRGVDPWHVAARVLEAVEKLLPNSTVRIVPTQYATCSRAWELEVEHDGRTSEVLAWGMFTDDVVRHLGGQPEREAAAGIGFGLERLAMLRHGIDDIRTMDVATVA